MSHYKPKLAIGFITFGATTAKYLPFFLPSLLAAAPSEAQILTIDNTEGDNRENLDILLAYPQIKLVSSGKNLGFAVAYNRMISLAKASGADYFLAVNPDMLLEKDSIGCLMAALNADGSLGSVSPKILKWLFGRADGPDGGRTQIIDSLGIALISGLRFVDIGQGVMEWEADKHVQLLGPSGAAGLYRMSALESSRLGNDYFDSGMFMYKEDCDLAYRLFLSGWKSEMVPEAIVYHDRTAAVAGKGWQTFMANRRAKGRLVNAWSLENQLVIYRRYWRLQSIGAKIKIIIDVTKAFVFASLREPYLLKSFYKAAFKRITPYGERS